MAVKVLGPMDTGGQTLGPRERAILAALIVRRGTTVAPSELAEAWWGEQTPPTWAQQVRNSVARIRSRLGRDVVETVATDYRLGLDADSIDATRFERIVSDARAHALHGEHDRAVDGYRRALALWRGAPLQDVATWEPGIVEAMRLGQIRASAEEELLDARLKAGEHRAVIPDAERLVREDPLREDRWAILALANYRADRQADALATLRAAREKLADELGLEPGARLTALETAMLRQDPSLNAPTLAQPASEECPYPGLRAFGPDDADLFFGRESAGQAVIDRLRPGAIIAIAGPSGSGKSSLALAGVVPRLRAGNRTVEILVPSRDAAAALRAAGRRAAVIVIDQAEEILAGTDSEIEDFCRACIEVLGHERALLLTVRSDALDRVRALPLIGDALGSGIYLLGALSIDGCREALEEPAHRAGLRLEPGLVELALRDTGDRASTLPHLSHAMRETWLRREGSTLTVDGYQASGGIAGAIAQSAEVVYRGLSPEQQELCRSIMLRLIDRGSDGVSTRRRIPSDPLLTDPERHAVVERLASARLLSVDHDTAMVAHEAVATAWPRLDGWLAEDADRARVLRSVEAAATAWDSEGRNDDDLLRGARLQLATTWREASARDLTRVEEDYLDASTAREQSVFAELHQRAVHERSRNRTLRFALSGVASLLVATVIAGGVAVARGQESARIAEDARVGEAVATSMALRDSDMDLASLIAAEAYQRWPDDRRVRSALLGILAASNGVERKLYTAETTRAVHAAIPYSGTALLVRDLEEGASLEVIDLKTGETLRSLDADLPVNRTVYYRNLWLSADGNVAVVQTPALREGGSCCLNDITFLDLETDDLLSSQTLDIRTGSVIALDAEGTTAYLSHPLRASVTEIDARTGAVRASDPSTLQPGLEGDSTLGGVAIINDRTVATSAESGVLIVDRATMLPVRTIPLPAGTHEWAVAAVADGDLLTGGATGASRVDSVSGEIVWTISVDHSAGCTDLATLGDQATFLCAGVGRVVEFDSMTGRATGRALDTQLDWGTTTTVVGDDTALLSAPHTNLAIVWSRDGAGVELVVPDRVAIDRPHSSEGLVPTATYEEQRLWNLGSGSFFGPSSEWMGWAGGDVLVRWDAASGYVLENTSSGESKPWKWTGSLARVDQDAWLFDGDGGPHGFVLAEDSVVPFDPESGRADSPPLYPIGPGEDVGVLSVTETKNGDRIAVTWFNQAEVRTETTVFDTKTGETLGTGLFYTDATAIVGSDILSAGDERFDRSPLRTLEPEVSLSRPVGGSKALSVSTDGTLAMSVGFNGMITLYDLERGIRLGDPIKGDTIEDLPAGFLSPDGLLMLVNTWRGVTAWTLDLAQQAAAACAIAGREFTPQEWATHFGWTEQSPTTCAGELG